MLSILMCATLCCTSPLHLTSTPSSTPPSPSHSSALTQTADIAAARTTVKPLEFAEQHRVALRESGDVQDFIWSGEGELFLFTSTSLWLYNHKQRQLRRISLPPTAAGTDTGTLKLALTEQQSPLIFLQKPQHTYLIRLKPELKVLQLASSKPSLGAGLFHGYPTLLSRTTLHSLDTAGKTIQTLTLPPLPQDKTKLKALIDQQHVWLYSSSDIWTLQEKKGSDAATWKLLTQGLRSIRNLHTHQQYLIIQTPYTIITMNYRGEMEQTIPVSSSRKISHIELNDTHHLYSFDDGRIEIYNTHNRSMKFLELPLKVPTTLDKVALQGLRIAALVQGELRLFELPSHHP